MSMKKQLLLIATALLTLSGHVHASNSESELNAVCVSLKSGTTEFVAFSKKPQIKADGGKLYVVSTDDQQQLLLADLSNVEKITATSHDFTAIGKVTIDGNTTEEIYDLSGKRVTEIIPGRIYIIKVNGQTKKVRK